MMANTTTANSLGAGAIDSSQHKELDQGIYCVLKETRARLFLGTQRAAQNRQLLRRHGVSRIVCVGTPAFHRDKVGGEEPLEGRDNDGEEGDSCNTIGNNNGSGFTYLEVPVLDLPSENLLVRLDECTSFIEGGMRRGQGVFVNCVFAQSRSVAVVAAYLMKHKAMPYLRAVDEVRKAQPTVHINPGFEAQLALYRDMGCRLPGTRHEEVEEPPARVNSEATGTAMDNRGPASFRVDATYRWFLFACAVTNGDQGSLQRLPFLNGGGEGSRRAGSDSGGPALVREGCGGGGGGGAAAAAATLRSRAAAYRCRACRAPLFSEANVVDHRHPVVQAASDSVYASFSRHGGDGSSWSAARDAAAAAAAGSASSLSSSSTFGARAPASKTSRGGKGAAAASRRVRGRGGDEIGGRVSTVGLASPAGGSGCCTSVFTEVLGWVEISEVCRGVACLGPREKFGKILCPGRKGRRGGAGVEAGTEALCQSKLGSWSLDGAACSCGRMVKPAFQFTLSRIERV